MSRITLIHYAPRINPSGRSRVCARMTARSGFPRATMLSLHVRRICAFLRSNYSERISLERVGARVGRNTAYVATLFRRQTGTTIHRYLTRVRMRRAAVLLRQSEKVEAVMLLV